jgi:hypothetical protein
LTVVRFWDLSAVDNPTSNLQIEIAFAGLASKSVVAVIATWPQTSDDFVVYPATAALKIASPYRHEAAEALQRVVRGMKPSFYFDLCRFDCRKLTLQVRCPSRPWLTLSLFR